MEVPGHSRVKMPRVLGAQTMLLIGKEFKYAGTSIIKRWA
jgi:hypothetical protein